MGWGRLPGVRPRARAPPTPRPDGRKTWEDVTYPQSEGCLCAMMERSGRTDASRRGRQPWPAETLPGMHLALVLAGPVRRRLRGHPEGPREGPGTSEEAAGVRI